MTTCRSGGPGAGEAAGACRSWAGEAEGGSFSYFLALRITGSVFPHAFSRISFALQAGGRPFLSGGTGVTGQISVLALLEGW